MAAVTAAALAFLPVLVDSDRAEQTRTAFTLQVEGDAALWLVELRNGVIVTEPTPAPLSNHIEPTAEELAGFVFGLWAPQPGSPLATLDRSGFVFLPDHTAAVFDDPDAEVHLLGQGSQ